MSTMPAETAGAAAPETPPVVPRSVACIACREPLPENETVCVRCHSQNRQWQEWHRGVLNRLTPEVLMGELRGLLPGALTLLLGWFVGLLFFVRADGVWGISGGLAIAFLGLIFAFLAAFDEWSARATRRVQQAVRAIARGLDGPDVPRALIGLMRAIGRAWSPISFSVVAGLLAPLALVGYPSLLRELASQLGLPFTAPVVEIGMREVLEVYLGVAYWMGYVLAAQAAARQGLRFYFVAADDHAPPYIFTRQTQFYDLCKQEAKHALLNGGEAKVTWLSMARRADGGLDLRAMVTVGNKKLDLLDEMRATHLPINKTYAIALDRWARVLSLKEEKKT